ncbi:MAG TPA: Lrp/AsnC ligand binding domain-containing protein [Nitrosopumilaceae archaeon]|nr:Lrp/AsnC ligand binding domain-containing protein [Nitrosopumilaceae archaeon]
MTIAYVLVKSDLGAEEKVVENLEKIEQVLKVERTFGDYDMVVKMESEHIEKIREIISWDIKKLDKIRSTLTLIKKE